MTYKELQKEVERIIGDPKDWTDEEVKLFLDEAKKKFREAGFEIEE